MSSFDFVMQEASENMQLELTDLETSTKLKHLFRRFKKLRLCGERKFFQLEANDNACCSGCDMGAQPAALNNKSCGHGDVS